MLHLLYNSNLYLCGAGENIQRLQVPLLVPSPAGTSGGAVNCRLFSLASAKAKHPKIRLVSELK